MNKSVLRSIFVASTLFSVLAGCGKSPHQGGGDGRAYVRLPKAIVTREFAAKHQFEADHKRDDTFVFGYMPRHELANLSDKESENLIDMVDRDWARVDFDAKTLTIKSEADTSIEAEDGYNNYEQLTAAVRKMTADNPSIAALSSAGKSAGGRELWVVKLSDNVEQEEVEPKLLYIANMHGDEVVGRELMLLLIKNLLSSYNSGNERVTKLLNNSQIYIMPSMNPDGFESHQRANKNGYDLNRNFPDFTSDNRDSPIGRQIETQHVMELHRQHHFVLALNFHGGDVCFNMPWDTKSNDNVSQRFGDDPLMVALGREYADANATMKANDGGSFDKGLTYGYEWYEINGGMQDWANYWRDSIHATVELSAIKWPNASALPGMWDENKEALLKYLERGLRGVHMRIKDDEGLRVAGPIKLLNGRRSLTYPSSYINRPTLDISQNVRLSAEGYEDLEVTLTPEIFSGSFKPLVMRRTLN